MDIKNYIALAHNLSYDGFFVMKSIVQNLLPDESTRGLNVLVNGGKLLCIQFRGVKIIDSYIFIPLALAKCPKTFGLLELKNYFPYLFNTISNQNAKDIPYPDVNYYVADYMTLSNRLEFLSWFEKQKDKVFDCCLCRFYTDTLHSNYKFVSIRYNVIFF